MQSAVIDLATFRYVVAKLEDLSTVLDTDISISLDLQSGGDAGSCCGFTLSLPLKNGKVAVVLANENGKLNYIPDNEEEAQAIELNYVGNLRSNFDTALRQALLADKAADN
jgi:hypothetical protein